MIDVTENLHHAARELDARPVEQIATLMSLSQIAAAEVSMTVVEAVCAGSQMMADSLRSGGSLYYAAAGSSALMAMADAMELGGTFGIAEDRIKILMAGGIPTSASMPGDTEDEIDNLGHLLSGIGPQDTLIGVSASGRTAFTVEAARLAKQAGALVIGLANNANTPLLELADCAIHLATGPEVISGGTRLGAGTAQKITLNMLSTVMAVQLGHVHDGMMVNLVADNKKLRQRAVQMVMTIAGVDAETAQNRLDQAEGRVKIACLLASGIATVPAAEMLLQKAGGRLRQAFAQTEPSSADVASG